MKLYFDKFDNLEDMDKFLETACQNWQEERDNVNRLITRSETESVIFKTSSKVQNCIASLESSTKHVKNLYLSCLNYSKKIEEEGNTPRNIL